MTLNANQQVTEDAAALEAASKAMGQASADLNTANEELRTKDPAVYNQLHSVLAKVSGDLTAPEAAAKAAASTATAWVAAQTGPTGPSGPTGPPTGPTGPTGAPTGPSGPTGSTGAYPSGITLPAPAAGMTRHFTDFKNGIDSSFWTAAYAGTPGGTNGKFLPSHVKVVNDALTVEAYQDTAAADSAANNWAGGGIQTNTRYPVGTTFYAVVRKDTYALWYAIQLLMGNDWPPEDDFEETATANSDTESIHYGAANEQVQAQASGLDLSDWGLWTHTWTKTGIETTLTVGGKTVTVAKMALPDTNASDQNSDVQPMFYSFQLQTEGGTSPTDPNVTAASPIKFQLEQFAADVPA